MPNQPAGSEDEDRALNPHRDQDRDRARQQVIAALHQRGVDLDDSASAEEAVNLLEAVEDFERAVQAAGGDLMTLERSKDPENEGMVIPQRSADESVSKYSERIRSAARSFGN